MNVQERTDYFKKFEDLVAEVKTENVETEMPKEEKPDAKAEGGLKFKGLKENKNVGIAIFEPYGGFGQLKILQVQGVASMVEPFSEEYLKLMEHKKIPVEAMKKLPQAMNLIKVVPTSYDYLDSDLKKDGFGSRQHLEV